MYTALARWIVVVVCCFRFHAQDDAESIASPKDGRPIRGSSNGNQFNGSPRHAPSRNRHPQHRFRPPLLSYPLPTQALLKRALISDQMIAAPRHPSTSLLYEARRNNQRAGGWTGRQGDATSFVQTCMRCVPLTALRFSREGPTTN